MSECIEAIGEDEVRKVAQLARLALNEDELRSMGAQLNGILGYMESLNAVDVTNVKPTYHPIPLGTPWREDRPQVSLNRREVLAAAPAHADGGFAVPQVMAAD